MSAPDTRAGRGGFTLVELLVTLLLFSILMAGIWSTFSVQREGLAAQDQVIQINNNVRIGAWDMGMDIMHAGLGRLYVSSGGNCHDLAVLQANPYQITFLMDADNSEVDDAANPDGPPFTWDPQGVAGLQTICDTELCSNLCSTTPNAGGANDVDGHAEVVRWTLDDPNTNQALVKAGAAPFTLTFNGANAYFDNIANDDQDTASLNPGDYRLWQQIIGRNIGSTPATWQLTGTGPDQITVAYGVRGPAGSVAPPEYIPLPIDTTERVPIFTYYLDLNADGDYACAAGAGTGRDLRGHRRGLRPGDHRGQHHGGDGRRGRARFQRPPPDHRRGDPDPGRGARARRPLRRRRQPREQPVPASLAALALPAQQPRLRALATLMRRTRPATMARSGFTLVELLVTLALTALLMTAVFAAMDSQRRSQFATQQISDINQNLRVAVDSMGREIRMAGLRTLDGQPEILQAGPFQIAFFADANGSCLCEPPGWIPYPASSTFSVRLAEDKCWGETTTADASGAAPGECGMTGNYDSPDGVQYYGTPIRAGNPPGHAELIVWTLDRPSNATTPGDAWPGLDFGTSDESLMLECDAGNPGIHVMDHDPQLSATGARLYNLYRMQVTNGAGGADTSVSKVASGIVGPCPTGVDAAGNQDYPRDEAGTEAATPTAWPLFSYWLDDDDDGEITNDCSSPLSVGEDRLWGDINGDCLFSDAEMAGLAGVAGPSGGIPYADSDMARILRVDIHVAARSHDKARIGTTVYGRNDEWRWRHLASSAKIRTRRAN